jgi:hypothetical protein
MNNIRSPFFALALLLAAVPVGAATVYQNGDTDRSGGSYFFDYFQAHDFRLNDAETITGVTLYALDLFDEGGDLPIFYGIYTNDANLRGATLASGVVTDFTRTALGPQQGFGDPEYRISFSFGEAINLESGTRYWLGLRYGDGTPGSGGLLWSNVGDNDSLQGAEFRDGAWIASFSEASFSLESGVAVVPEPASWAMLLAGFGLMGVGLRRRRIVQLPG